MSIAAVVTALVLVGVVLLRNRVAPGSAMLAATTTLLVTRVISSRDALAGFADPAVATVAALYVVARAVQRSGALQAVVERLMGAAGGWRAELLRLLVPATILSAGVNNTPIVTMLVPPVTGWADERGRPPSRYLLPLTYAVSLGGTLTLIGTSTNLVVSGLMTQAGMGAMGMFELTPIGIVVAVVGVLVLVIVGPLALAERRGARAALADAQRDFAISMTVIPGGAVDGASVEAAGLRHLQGVFLIEIRRREHRLAPVAPDAVLAGGDVLVFVGRADDIVDLRRVPGLAASEESHLAQLDVARHAFFEAVIGAGSPLVGETLKSVGFRGRYQGAVIAIHRAGERIHAKLGSVRLRVGDTLLFIADPSFRRGDFLIVNKIGTPPAHVRRRRGRWAALLFAGVVIVAGAGLLPLLEASLVAAALVLGARLITSTEAREAIDVEVILVVASALAIGAAVTKSGLGARLGDLLTLVAAPFGPRGVLAAAVVLTVLLAQVLTCNAAAAVAFPSAMAAAHHLGMAPRPMAIAVAIAASTTYLTPLGYQTKMMVWGPGGYRFGDYFRLGAPLTLVVIAALVVGVPLLWAL